MNDRKPITEDMIEAGATSKGAYTAATLAEWGVPWPPPKGWKQTLVQFGAPFKASEHAEGELQIAQRLLRVAVMCMIESGNSHLMDDAPELTAYFGGRNPHGAGPRPTGPDKIVEIVDGKRTVVFDRFGAPEQAASA